MRLSSFLLVLAGLQYHQTFASPLANPAPLPGDLAVRNPNSDIVERSFWSTSDSAQFWWTLGNTFGCAAYLAGCSTVCLLDVTKAGCGLCVLSIAVIQTCKNVITFLKGGGSSGGKFKRIPQTAEVGTVPYNDPHTISGPPIGYLPDCSAGDICYGKPINGTSVVGLCIVTGYAKQVDNYARAQKNGGGCSSVPGANGGTVTRDCDISVKPQQGCGVITS